MDATTTLQALKNLARELGIEIRRGGGLGDCDQPRGGAFVRLKGRAVIFLDPHAPPGKQILPLLEALRDHAELQDRFIPPYLRQLLDGEADIGR